MQRFFLLFFGKSGVIRTIRSEKRFFSLSVCDSVYFKIFWVSLKWGHSKIQFFFTLRDVEFNANVAENLHFWTVALHYKICLNIYVIMIKIFGDLNKHLNKIILYMKRDNGFSVIVTPFPFLLTIFNISTFYIIYIKNLIFIYFTLIKMVIFHIFTDVWDSPRIINNPCILGYKFCTSICFHF